MPLPGKPFIVLHKPLTAVLGATLGLSIVGCSAADPAPSPLHDGYYAGLRQSNRTEACGISQTRGATSARVVDGQLTMPLFGPKTRLTGTVGDDGTVRASGIWPNPTGGYPGMTVLNATISDNVMAGSASDFRCRTDIRLQKMPPNSGSSRPH